MHVKRLYRPTVREALAAAREQLGPGALVLSTELVPAPGWRGWVGQRVVRLTAAAERPSETIALATPAEMTEIPTGVTARRPRRGDQVRSGVAARLVAAGSTWKYRDSGVTPPATWKDPTFDDASWPSGPAQLGYGDGDEATLGITWFAQDALGELVHYEPPEEGAEISKGSSYGEVESVKAVSDVIAPLSGEVTAVNEALSDSPEKINEDPYGEGWLVKVKLTEASEAEGLLAAAAYKELLAG